MLEWIALLGLSVSDNQKTGSLGEKNAGITKNTRRIDSIYNPNIKYRIPDEMNNEGTLIKEVKNVNKQHFSSQQKDDIEHVKKMVVKMEKLFWL